MKTRRSYLDRLTCRGWPRDSTALRGALACAVFLASACGAGPDQKGALAASQEPLPPVYCLPDGGGFLRARLSGAINLELDWGNEDTQCTGAVRPTDGGIRMRFSRTTASIDSNLVVVFGIANLEEGRSAKSLPVNVTVIREGEGEFFSTQGDDKCMLDEVSQEAIIGIPNRSRSYRIVARGFCTEPARAVRGPGVVLMSRFDFAGRVDFEAEDTSEEPLVAHR